MNKLHTMALVAMVALSAAGTQALAQTAAKGTTKGANAKVTDADVRQMIESSFTSKGPATVEGVLNQDATQKACSQYPDRSKVPAAVAKKVEAAELKQVKYPADNNWIGDWKEGEKIAQNGRGMQFTDAVGGTNGGNCYACHQLTKAEISFGNIGPSLYQYGKLRGNSQEVVRYTWGKIWDSNAFSACSNMPRFGHKGILTEQQIRDVMALLLDPASPVNQ
ncbi:MAG: sulfur oxidation c-type cytochrome SoxX [Burkholderiaceae bacterium]|jgi:L-cysteine S-thiosulfotransferase|uniref:Sulfur oxidation c-type cytochrome SoxX n=1 Tax=Cupriavidus metallidurans TaxID=119219 RepID=A0A2L0XB92_9BURK|nr:MULTISPECIES: sulfur oxidation c-type cytochrome SoxX [Cupriavidus]PCH54767.1 MAG: sulfur oxidation c-type cytochrome SoxX [Burkholderiaceae bacterium]AVA37355.1 sulfur oxidation c-type cytochrome SoxX [Cupriavidus metallidurans]EKZ98398.1 sulfur oxidation protein SoxX [Cupriavidus sp. HMR-1]KWR84552.1 sulfur oxidation c-type cytochrome SoxX [Cupriavidus sp. SHE]QBP11362.1 sulfur oxidation c-type cytochrome SoxX [Cupriavidus metallidurans]